LGQLYKTEIRLLATALDLPRAVIDKAPSADLWEGQSDEDELGFTYAEVDHLLHHLVDQRLGRQQLTALGFRPDLVAAVKQRLAAMAFKRRLPPTARVPGRLDPDPKSDDSPGIGSFTDGGFH
jgi:NAD+ synthase